MSEPLPRLKSRGVSSVTRSRTRPLRFAETNELLSSQNHPFVNWDYVLQQLRTISIGADFYEYNRHENGLEAVRIILQIYLSVIQSFNEEIREMLYDTFSITLIRSYRIAMRIFLEI